MSFTDPLFLYLFLPVTVLATLAAQNSTARLIVFIAASVVQYTAVAPQHVLLLIGICACNLIALLGLRCVPSRAIGNRLAIFIAVCNLFPLIWVKYRDAELAQRLGDFAIGELVIPLGISFYTFQIILFYVSGEWREKSVSPLRFTAFVTFFPQLVLGPIQRYRELVPQLLAPKPSVENQILGLLTIALALAKKLIFAEALLDPVDGYKNALINGDALTSFDMWLYILASSAYIYVDFSAYADIAVGVALLLGVRLIDGFTAPFRAKSVGEFWRRWNVSLMRFFREAIYNPLRNRLGTGPSVSAVGVLVVMLASGAWHGAGWHFVAWGAAVAALVILERGLSRIFSLNPWLIVRRFWVVTAFIFPIAVFLHADWSVSALVVVQLVDVSAWMELPRHVYTKLPEIVASTGLIRPVEVAYRISSWELVWITAIWCVILFFPSTPEVRAWLRMAIASRALVKRELTLSLTLIVSLGVMVCALAVRPGSDSFFYFQF